MFFFSVSSSLIALGRRSLTIPQSCSNVLLFVSASSFTHLAHKDIVNDHLIIASEYCQNFFVRGLTLHVFYSTLNILSGIYILLYAKMLISNVVLSGRFLSYVLDMTTASGNYSISCDSDSTNVLNIDVKKNLHFPGGIIHVEFQSLFSLF